MWKQSVGKADFRCAACIPCRSPCLSSKQAVRYYELIYSRSIRHAPRMLSLTNTITSYMASLQRHSGSLWTCTVALLLSSEEKRCSIHVFQLLMRFSLQCFKLINMGSYVSDGSVKILFEDCVLERDYSQMNHWDKVNDRPCNKH